LITQKTGLLKASEDIKTPNSLRCRTEAVYQLSDSSLTGYERGGKGLSHFMTVCQQSARLKCLIQSNPTRQMLIFVYLFLKTEQVESNTNKIMINHMGPLKNMSNKLLNVACLTCNKPAKNLCFLPIHFVF